MKRALLAALSLAILASAAWCADDVVLRPDSDIRIVEIGDFQNTQFWLRELLEKYLLRALGKRTLAGKGKPVVFVIEAKSPTWREMPKGSMKDLADVDAFEVAVLPGDPPAVRITGSTVMATGFGLMRFLEERLGVMWLFPGELGVHVPKRREFRLRAGTERDRPFFVSRLCTGFVYRDKTIPAKRFVYKGLITKCRFFFYAHDFYKSLMLHALASPSHNMIRIFPLTYRKTDKDIFPVKDGKRWMPPDKDTPKGRVGYWQAWHPCYTSPKVVDIAARKAADAFRGGQLCFSLGINDGRRIQCECPKCKRVGWPNSYYQFVKQVAERVKDAYPPHLLGVIAYGDVTHPPADLSLPENVLVMAVSGGPDRITEWSRHAKLIGTYEWAHGQGYFYPNFPLDGIRNNARYYRDHHVRFFRNEFHPIWAFDAPKVYLTLRLLWNPDFDVHAALRRYCDAAYGAGGEAIRRFLLHWASKRKKDARQDSVTRMHGGEWPFSHWRNAVTQFQDCSAEDFAFSARCIAEAKGRVASGPQRKRLEMLEGHFDYCRTLFDMNHFADVGCDPAADPRAAIRKGVALLKRRQDTLERLRDHPEWFLGTSGKVGKDLRPSWEERAQMIRGPQTANVVLVNALALAKTDRAAAGAALPKELRHYLRARDRGLVLMHARPKHPWFRPALYDPLEINRRGTVLRFKTRKTDGRITEHPGLKGKRKPHWLAAFTVGLLTSDKDFYVLDIETTGRRGRLQGRVVYGSGAGGCLGGYVFADIGDTPKTLRRRLILRPLPRHRRTGKPIALGLKGNLNVYLRWLPSHDDAPLKGHLRLTRFTPGGKP